MPDLINEFQQMQSYKSSEVRKSSLPVSTRDLSKIEEKLNAFLTVNEKVRFLQNCISQRVRSLAAFERGDRKVLEILKEKTKADYEKYQLSQPVHLSPLTYERTAKRLELHDIHSLIRRLELEGTYDLLQEDIALLEDLKTKIQTDPYEIKYYSDNSIGFRADRIYFPFPSSDIFRRITTLREKLLNKTVCGVDLQQYPSLIFDDPNFKGHHNLAAWIYNILYTWAKDINSRVYKGDKEDLFNEFLKLCKEKALAWQSSKNGSGLTISQIAIIHVYKGEQITRKNATEIAVKYGHKSGEKLFQKFTYYSSTANRKGKPDPCTKKKLANKIEMLQSAVSHLDKSAAQRANDEIQILSTIYENEFQ